MALVPTQLCYSDEQSYSLYESIEDEIVFIDRGCVDVTFRGKIYSLQRDTAFFADSMHVYMRYPSNQFIPCLPWTPTLLKIKQELEKLVNHPLNHCIINRYVNGKDRIGAHHDKYTDLHPESNVVALTLYKNPGKHRVLKLTDPETNRVVSKHELCNGWMYMLTPELNRTYKHEVPPAAGKYPSRISLTFRYVTSKFYPETGIIVKHDGSQEVERQKPVVNQKRPNPTSEAPPAKRSCI
jgi:alkylated DNA repair dioxygenase AlkB